MEATASGLIDLKELVERFLGGVLEDGMIEDGAMASSSAQAAAFWRIREGIIEAQAQRGRHLRTDVSIPISGLAAFLDETQAALHAHAPDATPLAYGHLGDGNIHFNVLPPADLPEADVIALMHACEAIIFDRVDAAGGSISAEHGIGRVKREAFEQRCSALDLRMLHHIKTALDPYAIMNPGRVVTIRPRREPRQ
jgi:FAD/FMN-containing dehydrogenase